MGPRDPHTANCAPSPAPPYKAVIVRPCTTAWALDKLQFRHGVVAVSRDARLLVRTQSGDKSQGNKQCFSTFHRQAGMAGDESKAAQLYSEALQKVSSRLLDNRLLNQEYRAVVDWDRWGTALNQVLPACKGQGMKLWSYVLQVDRPHAAGLAAALERTQEPLPERAAICG